jgi:uncharacterized membrane protein YeaQ/YmgE (transglycosylase-associated protein family)
MGILSWALWGLFVGAFARLLRPGRQAIGFWFTILLGIAGSLLGGFLATKVLHVADSDEFDLGSFLIAVGTSVVILAIWERVERALPDRRRRDELPRRGFGR